MRRCVRCDWRVEDGDRDQQAAAHRAHADEADHPICVVCGHRSLPVTHRQTCAECVGAVRADLADIRALYQRLPGVMVESRYPSNSGSERTAGTQEDPLPGGDALVMFSPGGTGSVTGRHLRGSTPERPAIDYPAWPANSDRPHPAWTPHETGLPGREHVADNLHSDAPSTEAVLGWIEDDWRHLQEQPAAGPPTVTEAVEYLMSQLDRMAQAHSEFDVTAEQLRDLRLRLRAVTGLADRPETGAPCVYCHATLEQHYGDEGLEEERVCPRCRRIYTAAEYWLAVKAELERQQEAG